MNSESEEAEFNFPSLSFPGFLAEDISSARLGDWYAILLILTFGIGDLIGKAGAHHLPPWSSNTVRARAGKGIKYFNSIKIMDVQTSACMHFNCPCTVSLKSVIYLELLFKWYAYMQAFRNSARRYRLYCRGDSAGAFGSLHDHVHHVCTCIRMHV